MMSISMVDLKSQYDRIQPEIDKAITKVVHSTAFINGPEVSDFSQNLEKYLGVKHVIPCANGTDALQIALMSFDFEKGTEVLVPSWTYIATVEVIALLGLTPVFVEVDPDTFLIDPIDLEKKITRKSAAVIPVHLYGQCANMTEISKIAGASNLRVIEDTAQALGAEYYTERNHKKAGTMGDIGVTSFFPSKNLGCFGDGGAIFTNNDELAKRLKMIVNHGQSKKYIHDIVGVNSRLDTLQAAILNVKLKYLDEFSKARNDAASFYSLEFESVDEIQTPTQSTNSSHVYHQYTIKVAANKRDELRSLLAEEGVPSMIYYPIPCHLQKAYNYFGYKVGDLPITEQLSNEVLSLPIHTEMSKDTLKHISDSVKKILS